MGGGLSNGTKYVALSIALWVLQAVHIANEELRVLKSLFNELERRLLVEFAWERRLLRYFKLIYRISLTEIRLLKVSASTIFLESLLIAWDMKLL